MAVDTSSLFAQVIQEHLALKERNAELEPQLPLERYKSADPFENHPLFKTEEQARLEETMDGDVAVAELDRPVGWPGDERTAETPAAPAADADDSGLWSRSPDFDWGD